VAPHIGAELGRRLSQAGINYLDRQGNCHLALGGQVLVHVEGRGPGRVTATEKGIRAPGYQVLFALLAEPSLVDAPIRALAQAAGTSRQPVVDMRHRLLSEGYLVETRSAVIWQPRRRDDALNRWLHGYETTVRPTLFVGTFRTPDRSPAELERRVAPILDGELSDWRLGGAAAAFRLVAHHRGERTVVHVHEAPANLAKKLGGLADPHGNLIVLRAFGDLNWPPNSKLVHPLLVYSEMLIDKDDRASEAAREVFEKHVESRWSASP
jgi:hypothetical protein